VLAPLLLGVSASAHAQQSYPSPDAAAAAFTDALAKNDEKALGQTLGANWRRFIPAGEIYKVDVDAYLAAWASMHEILSEGDRALISVGTDGWTMPIPIAKTGEVWRFDVQAGAKEIRLRRIGRNELAVIKAMLAYYDAQKEYALTDHNGDGVLEYAQRIVSTPGKQNGLYWAALPGEPDSPLGPLFGDDKPGSGYHGYQFRILTRQGTHAPGGKYDYRIGNRMTAGFALVAWPAKYRDTGVMTFMVSHDGQVVSRDLGQNTDALARKLTRFDPDSTWKKETP
jgi:hypothetical protein